MEGRDMKKMTRLVALALVAMLCLSLLAACAPEADEAGSTATSDDLVQIGVVQIVEHPALDAARKGFVDGMAEAGYVEGEQIELDVQNAQGDQNTLSTIADGFVSKKKDLIFAIATPSAQAVAAKTTEIPIVGTAITDYVAADLADSNDVPGGNVTGTSDMNPVAEQIALAKELVPDAETIGFIYSSKEANSVLQINIAEEAAAAQGLKTVEVTVEGTNDVQQAMTSLVKKCDVIYIPTDNTLASSMAIVSEVANKAKIATICGESNMVEGGGFATMGIDYYELGKATATMAIAVINGDNPANMPIGFIAGDTVVINGDVAEILGITIPEKFAADVMSFDEAAE
jgi:putative ABC transport system substrate-binding protein